MKRIISLLALLPLPAMATESSMLCKTSGGMYVDIVSVSKDSSSVLVQLDGGTFFNGHAAFTDPQLVVTVPFDQGLFFISWDVRSNQGSSMMMMGSKKAVENIECRFRK